MAKGAAMRVAVLSDIHGNLLALEAVLADLEAAGGAEAVVIAGDLCLDGPQPRETLQRLRALGFPMVQGNTDRDLALDPAATAASEQVALLDWTRQALGEDGLAYLRQLPFAYRVQGPDADQGILIVHANPKTQDDPLRPFAPEGQIAPFLDAVSADVAVVAFGHLHLPFTREVGRLLLADISSVGLPKDGDRRAGYGLITWADGGWTVEQRRVEYPVEEVVAQLREAAPPDADELIKILLRARYPNMTAARGGRAPNRRTAAASQPVVAPEPDDSEALIVRIGNETPGQAAISPLAPDRATDGEPIAAPQEAVSPDETPLTAPMPDVTLEQVTTTLAAPTLPEVEPMPDTTPADAPVSMPDDMQEAAATPIIDDAALAWDVDEASAAAATAAVDSPSREATVSAETDDDEADIADEPPYPTDDAELAGVFDAAADEAQATEPKKSKQGKRPKKAHKAAKRAAIAQAEILFVADASFVAVLPALLGVQLNDVLSQLEAVRADDDPEAVHDMRVAIRRLRSVLVVAEPYFARKPFRRASRRVRALARALGQVRDADVLLGHLRERYMTVADDERIGIEGLIDMIEADRAGARDDLDPVLDEWDEDGPSAAEFQRFLAKTKSRSGKARERDLIGVVAARALDDELDMYADCATILDEEGGDAEAFHTLRIAGKKLRYTIELFAPVLGEDAEDLLTTLKTLQGLLGELHDRDVLVDLLSWERVRALERQLHSLEFATFNPGTRDERLDATRQLLAAPDSFAATAIGSYGLLIDTTIERDALEDELRAAWSELGVTAFLSRLRGLADQLLQREPDAPDAPAEGADDEGEVNEDEEA